MAGRSAEDVRRELESEREGLTDAVGELREEGGKLKSKLPVVLGGFVAGVVALRALRRALGR
jgi:hypothetical protein